MPNDADFQTRIITSALELLEAPDGPLLEDYPEDSPEVDGPATLVCPVSFDLPEISDDESKMKRKFLEEVALLRPWYDTAIANSSRTTLGVSGIEPDSIGPFIAEFLDDGLPTLDDDENPGVKLKLAVEDLKAFYNEAATAQPGQEHANAKTIAEWFWRETVAGNVLRAIRDTHQSSEDRTLRFVAGRQLIPRAYSGASAPQA